MQSILTVVLPYFVTTLLANNVSKQTIVRRMRKIIVSMNVSVDGYMAAPGGELDWHFEKWTSEMAETLCEQLSKADTIMLGGRTYSAMAAYWPQRGTDYRYPREDIAFAEMMNSYQKVVFSKTLKRLPWHNSRLLKQGMEDEILKLKKAKGKDIIIFGSATLVASLINLRLIDEYVLWVHPIALNGGTPLFATAPGKLSMQLTRITKFRSGVIVLYYKVPAERAVAN